VEQALIAGLPPDSLHRLLLGVTRDGHDMRPWAQLAGACVPALRAAPGEGRRVGRASAAPDCARVPHVSWVLVLTLPCDGVASHDRCRAIQVAPGAASGPSGL
jgi:hypothetical protein